MLKCPISDPKFEVCPDEGHQHFERAKITAACYNYFMKTRYKYGLVFASVHALIAVFAVSTMYEPNVPNGALGMLVFPNIIIPLPLTDILPDIFGYWSNLYWGGLFWFLIGFIIGIIIEKRRLKSHKVEQVLR